MSGIGLIFVGTFVVIGSLVVIPFLGPVGLFGAVVGAVIIGVGTVRELRGPTADSAAAPARVNCPECGARNDVTNDECRYCGEPLE